MKITSTVWNTFSRPHNNFVCCRKCKKNLKYFGNTTNLRYHIKRWHPEATEYVPAFPEENNEISSTIEPDGEMMKETSMFDSEALPDDPFAPNQLEVTNKLSKI